MDETARRPMKATVVLLLAALTAAAFSEARPAIRERIAERVIDSGKPTPPRQPKSGPGSSDYPHAGFRETEHGEEGKQFWILEPDRPTPKKAPFVIFLHGYSAMHPATYRGWLNHLARRGNIIVYPRYQERLLTPPAEYFENSATAVRSALAILREPGHVTPDLEHVAVVGHSVGGVGAVNYTVRARAEGLPAPKAVMIVEPGQGMDRGVKVVPMDDCTKLPQAIHLILAVGDSDGLVGSGCARTIWQDTGHIRDRSFVTLQSDDHGVPPLRANHLSPVSWTREATDALDWYGYWKLFDGLTSAAFAGKDYTVDTNMGAWSDDTPVKLLKVER